MVGVGPGVGADIIRQRRRRADKLKKEQKVSQFYKKNRNDQLMKYYSFGRYDLKKIIHQCRSGSSVSMVYQP